MAQFATVAGAFASVAALGALVHQWALHIRRRRVRTELAISVGRLLRIRRWLVAWIASVSQDSDLEARTNGYLTFYAGVALELEQHISEVRALDADGANERLRDDVEQAVRSVLRQWDWAASLLPESVVVDGLDHPHGLHAVERGRGVNLDAEERELILLFRSIMRRLGRDNDAEQLHEQLPLDPRIRYDVDALWGGDVRPLL